MTHPFIVVMVELKDCALANYRCGFWSQLLKGEPINIHMSILVWLVLFLFKIANMGTKPKALTLSENK
jgi:hypothetical protein